MSSASTPRRKGLAFYGGVVAASVSGYYLYQWAATKYNTYIERQSNQALDHGRNNLINSCKVWEASLQRAVDNGDIVRANRLRQVLRKAYQTLEALESIESLPAGVGSVSPHPRLNRGYLEKMGNASTIHHDDTDSDFDRFSEVEFESAASVILQDIDGTSVDVENTPRRTESRASSGNHTKPSRSPRHNGKDMWEEAQSMAARDEITVRKVRLEYTACKDKLDFIARVHCFRQAMAVIMGNEAKRNLWKDAFMHVLNGILIKGGNDPAKLVIRTQQMEEFINAELQRDNLTAVTAEMCGRGIPTMNFYDVVFDYLLFDALDAIKLPPDSVKSALENKWVPVSIRASTMNAAVWSIVRARLALFPRNTFMYNFYNIIIVLAPALACGLLGVGDPTFIKLNKDFWGLLVEFIGAVFAIPGTTHGPLTPESYADKIIETTKRYIPRANAMVAKALESK